jgi:hypothetical protein
MFLETVLDDAVHTSDTPRRPGSALAGRWRNRRGSTVELVVHDDHHIHGTFRTQVMRDPDMPFHLSGFTEGDAVVFSVDFGRRGSVASWSGHHLSDDDGERLVTLWHLARPVAHPHSESELSAAIMTGADEFVRVTDD